MSAVFRMNFYGSQHVRLRQSFWGRWSIEVFEFPAMRLVGRRKFGWDREAACEAYDRIAAVYVAARALGVTEAKPTCNLIRMPMPMTYHCQTCGTIIDEEDVQEGIPNCLYGLSSDPFGSDPGFG